MLQAMNTGHDGSLTTIHANTPRDALARMETMAMMGSVSLPEKAIRAQIASAVHLMVQIARMSDGSRRVTHITELTGAFSDVISMQDIFLFEKEGMGLNGKGERALSRDRHRAQIRRQIEGCGHTAAHRSA